MTREKVANLTWKQANQFDYQFVSFIAFAFEAQHSKVLIS